ncbi:hypothetical protein GCM10028796_30580 [Ramlibacter monticola]|uniref:Glycosyltransferase 99 N-terminal domain-containing protein n=1 Tax=Ramlibacter monticola TaxID=1926872 RepID=A0A937CVR8_9BURK|nr:hypothetical protein [Ramlibacter monticola]MBL0394711.1 hypothetical protein [Ramlibacter monticola]
MLAAFLPPYPFRGTAAPYLWWYYRLLTLWSDESAYFITGREYTQPVAHWQDRWECLPGWATRLDYRLPDEPHPAQHRFGWLDDRFGHWLASAGGNPLAVFRRFLTERDAVYEDELRSLLKAAPAALEAVITPCNVPSLEAVCAELAIPVIHVELGPMRAPVYRDTGYVDFRGVNGNTECASRYAAWHGRRPPFEWNDLLHFFGNGMAARLRKAKDPEWDIGIVLQVEDDSNLVAFGNGMDNLGLLLAARLQAQGGRLDVCVRPHPGSVFALRDPTFRLDDSPDSFTFVQRSARVLTTNSSVGLEAVLVGRPAEAFGDCSFDFLLSRMERSEQLDRLAFYLLGYLVPFALQLEPQYLRFRLGAPSEESIIIRHLEEYMRQQDLDHKIFSELSPETRAAVLVFVANHAKLADERVASLEKTLKERDERIDGFINSMSWKVTAPLRWVHRRILLRHSASR